MTLVFRMGKAPGAKFLITSRKKVLIICLAQKTGRTAGRPPVLALILQKAYICGHNARQMCRCIEQIGSLTIFVVLSHLKTGKMLWLRWNGIAFFRFSTGPQKLSKKEQILKFIHLHSLKGKALN